MRGAPEAPLARLKDKVNLNVSETHPPAPPETRPIIRVPADVFCANHAQNGAASVCYRCGDLICPLCTVVVTDPDDEALHTFCASCSALIRPPRLVTSIPWEHRKQIGWWKAAVATTRMVIKDPRGFYRAMPAEGEMGDAVLFVLVLRGTSMAVAQGFFAVFYIILALATQETRWAIQAGTQIIATPFAFLGAIINAFMMAGLLHLVLLLFAPRYGFQTTFRIHAYSAAVDIFQMIPLVGAFIVWPWQIYLHIIAFQEIHELTPTRAIIAALAPTVLGLFIGFAIVGLAVVFVLVAGI